MNTSLVGTNARGDLVGNYVDSAIHGFVHRDENVQTIDIPGAIASFALGINARGIVVGGSFGNDGRDHGFALLRKP